MYDLIKIRTMQTNQNCFHAYFRFIIMHLGKLRVWKVTFLQGHVLVSSLLHSSLVDFLAQVMYEKTIPAYVIVFSPFG